MQNHTLQNYLERPDNERYEIIHGEVIKMTLPPTIHQKVRMDIAMPIANFLHDKSSEIFFVPFAARLFEQQDDTPDKVNTVVEPDIMIICDPTRLDDYGCKGAPDMVIEILSPSTMHHDRIVKFELYRRAGVREYWIVDPQNQSVEVYLRDENNDLSPHEVYTRGDTAKVTVLDGCTVELAKVFPETK